MVVPVKGLPSEQLESVVTEMTSKQHACVCFDNGITIYCNTKCTQLHVLALYPSHVGEGKASKTLSPPPAWSG